MMKVEISFAESSEREFFILGYVFFLFVILW